MNAWVLDASVAARWFLPPKQETLVEESLAVLDEFAAGRCRLMVPDLFWPEVGNILWKAVRAGRVTAANAEASMDMLIGLGLETRASAKLAKPALQIAIGCGQPAYDSMYVALAVMSGIALLTADERLVNALGARFPVRWLGGIQVGS